MKRFAGGMLVLAVLVMLAAGLNGRLDELFPLDVPTSVTNTAGSAQTIVVEGADQGASTAIQQVIQRSNDEQVQAIAQRDSSLMADTVTSDHYRELVQVNQDLLDAGVAAIQLTKLDWGAVAANGDTATATTFETWTTTYVDGSTEQSRDR